VVQELRRRIDPVFLPRPLLFVARLPRNSTGKLPQEALRSLAATHLKSA
jgi:acyl-coenzyme A synthetase/AMP-(fatty) acid ligase